MKAILLLSALFLVTGCATTRQSPTFIPKTTTISKAETKIKAAKDKTVEIKKVLDKENQAKIDEVTKELEDALSLTNKATEEVEKITAIANDNFNLYLEKLREIEKLKKSKSMLNKEAWFWRLFFIGAILFLTRKLWLRFLGIGI